MDAAPVFVKISKYKELAGILTKIQQKLNSADKTIEQLQKVKDEEDARIQEWKENLEIVQKKLESVGAALHQHK